MGKYVIERHFDGDDLKNEILAPLIDCHDSGRTVSWEPKTFYYLVLGTANRFF